MGSILENLKVLNPKAVTIEGHDSALIGIGGQFGKYLAVYSESIILKNLMASGMTVAESYEWLEYNIAGAYMGENAPIIVTIDQN